MYMGSKHKSLLRLSQIQLSFTAPLLQVCEECIAFSIELLGIVAYSLNLVLALGPLQVLDKRVYSFMRTSRMTSGQNKIFLDQVNVFAKHKK